MFRGPSSCASERVIAFDGAFRRTVNTRGRRSRTGGDRADVDHAAAVFAEQLRRFLRGQQQAEHVEIELLVEVLGRHFFQRRELVNAGVVYENIEFVEFLFGGGEEVLNLCGLGEIDADGDRTATFFLDFVDNFIRARFAGRVVHDDCGAVGGQVLGDSGADPFRGSGDDRDFPGKFL